MRLDQVVLSFFPTFFAEIGYARPVLVRSRLHHRTRHPAACSIIPNSNVQDDFPNAMNSVDRTRSGSSRIHAAENFQNFRPVPGFALEGTPELVGVAGSFTHRPSHPSDLFRVNRFIRTA